MQMMVAAASMPTRMVVERRGLHHTHLSAECVVVVLCTNLKRHEVEYYVAVHVGVQIRSKLRHVVAVRASLRPSAPRQSRHKQLRAARGLIEYKDGVEDGVTISAMCVCMCVCVCVCVTIGEADNPYKVHRLCDETDGIRSSLLNGVRIVWVSGVWACVCRVRCLHAWSVCGDEGACVQPTHSNPRCV